MTAPEQYKGALEVNVLQQVMAYQRTLEESLGLSRPRRGIVIAGPCIIEEDLTVLEKAAETVSKLGIPILRGGSFKNRTSYRSFQGLEEDGLKYHVQICRHFGLKSVSEIMDGSQVDLFRDIDILQIGEKNMKNYILMREVAKMGKPVVLKRNVNSSIGEVLHATEKFLQYGQERIVLCERGINASSHEMVYRNVLDLNAVAWLKASLKIPVIVDPSHSAGIRSLVAPLAKAAIAVGCDGLMVEAHCDPESATCDREQALSNEDLIALDAAVNLQLGGS